MTRLKVYQPAAKDHPPGHPPWEARLSLQINSPSLDLTRMHRPYPNTSFIKGSRHVNFKDEHYNALGQTGKGGSSSDVFERL